MTARGHDLVVVCAHAHYPEPIWGRRLKPYREIRDGIPVYRLPLKIGRRSKAQRLSQELSFVASLSAAAPLLPPADAIVAISPSFPALLPAMANAAARSTPWVIWLQDILPDGAASTGYVEQSGPIYKASRWLEDSAYRSAAHIVVLSETFRENLVSKGVPASKISLAYNPATFPAESRYLRSARPGDPPRILCMGNIGRSQNLPAIVEAFEADPRLAELGARLVIAGTGVSEPEVRAAVRTDRVEMPGLLLGQDLIDELERAHLGLVSQSYEGAEFNVPSKLMNYLAVGLPVISSVNPEGEVASILESSGAGWVTDRVDTGLFASSAARVLEDQTELERRSRLGVEFAEANLMPDKLAARFDSLLAEIAPGN
jgi:colanic acid biosynthesis glycosyl transferase WcaI